METMTDSEWRAFLSAGARTGKLATTRSDGRPHVVPVWFVLDGDDVVFNTGEDTVKGRNLRQAGVASMCVDDERPPFSYVTVSGPVTLITDVEAMLPPVRDRDRRALHGGGAGRAVRPAQRR